MAFQQNKLTRTVNQSQDIFDKYIYRPTTGDTIETMSAVGYFAASRYADDDGWFGGIMEIDTGTEYYFCKITVLGLYMMIDGSGNDYNPIAPDGWIYNPTNQGTYAVPVKGDWRSKVQPNDEDPLITRLIQERLDGFGEWEILQSLGGSVTSDGFIITDSTEGFAYGKDVRTLVNVGPSMGGALLGNEFADSTVRMKKGFGGSKEDPNITVMESQPINDEQKTLEFNPDRGYYEYTFEVMENVTCIEESIFIMFEKEQDFTGATFRTGNRLMDGNDSVANVTLEQFGSGQGQVPVPGINKVQWFRQYPVEEGVAHIGFIQSTKPLIILGSTIDGEFIPAFTRDVHIIEPLWHTAFPYFVSGTTYTKGQWLTAGQEAYPIETKLYKCLVDGEQTGTLESNAEKWQLIGDAEYLIPLRESQLDASTARIGEVFTVTDVDSATNPATGYADGRWTFGSESIALLTAENWSLDEIIADPTSSDWFNILRNEAWSMNRLQYQPSSGKFKAWYNRDGTSSIYSFEKAVSEDARVALNTGGVEFKFKYGLDDEFYPQFDIVIDGDVMSFSGSSGYTYTIPRVGAIAGTTMNDVQGFNYDGERIVNSEGAYIETAIFTGKEFKAVNLDGDSPVDIGGIIVGDIAQEGLMFTTPTDDNYAIPQAKVEDGSLVGSPFFYTNNELPVDPIAIQGVEDDVVILKDQGYAALHLFATDYRAKYIKIQIAPEDVGTVVMAALEYVDMSGHYTNMLTYPGVQTTVGGYLLLPLIETAHLKGGAHLVAVFLSKVDPDGNGLQVMGKLGTDDAPYWELAAASSDSPKVNLATEDYTKAAVTPIESLVFEGGTSETPVTKDEVLITGTVEEGFYRAEMGFNIHSSDGKWISWVNMGAWLDDVPLGPVATGTADTTQADKYANASGVRYITVPSGGGEYKVTMNCSSEDNAARFGAYAYLTKIS